MITMTREAFSIMTPEQRDRVLTLTNGDASIELTQAAFDLPHGWLSFSLRYFGEDEPTLFGGISPEGSAHT